jgi:exonuclease VII small subunit
MTISGIRYDQGVNSISFNQTNSESNKGLTAGQTDESDTVYISGEAMELSRKGGANKNPDDSSNAVGKKNNDLDRALALFKEVGFEEYRNIMKTLRQIEKALAKTIDDFPAYKESLEAIGKDLNDNLPRSVDEAMFRLNEALKDFPEGVKESVLRHLEGEKEKDNILAGADSGLPLTLG